MRDFDALPETLRRWLAGAVLPWSPTSCRRIWQRSRAREEGIDALLARLDRAERRTLMRDPVTGPMATPETDPSGERSRT